MRQRLLTFVLVGGGPTGVELAGTLAEIARQMYREFRRIDTRTTRIVLVEAGPTILRALHRRCATPRGGRCAGSVSRSVRTPG